MVKVELCSENLGFATAPKRSWVVVLSTSVAVSSSVVVNLICCNGLMHFGEKWFAIEVTKSWRKDVCIVTVESGGKVIPKVCFQYKQNLVKISWSP